MPITDSERAIGDEGLVVWQGDGRGCWLFGMLERQAGQRRRVCSISQYAERLSFLRCSVAAVSLGHWRLRSRWEDQLACEW